MSELDNALLSDPEELSNEAVKGSTMARAEELYGQGSKVGRSDYTVGDDGNYYNSEGERVYYWSVPYETDSTMKDTGAETQGIGQDMGGYYTEAEIRSAWDAKEGMGYFKERISWDNYMAFITERQGLIQSGDLPDPTDPAYMDNYKATDSQFYPKGEAPPANVGSSLGGGRDEEVYLAKQSAAGQDMRNQAMAAFVDANAELMAKYGIEPVFQNKDGDTFMFNGSTYVRTNKIDDHGHYGQLIGGALMGLATAGALAPVGAGLFGAGAVGKGVTAGVSNALTQAAMTGSIDPRSVLTSGLMGGLNPGGRLSDALGMNPDSFGAGVVGGFTDSATRGLLSGDGVDFGKSLLAGLGKGAANSILDFFKDMSDRSVEDRMRIVQAEHEASFPLGKDDPAYYELTDQELYDTAMSMQGTGTSDLGGLIGKDGLIPGMDEVSTKWVNGLLGGGRFDLTGVFIGPDGKQYTDTEIMEMGMDPSEIGRASLYGETVDGFSYAVSSQEKTWLGQLWDAMKENVPGIGAAADFIDNGMDAAARRQFIDEYGFDPYEHPDAARQVFLYGKVDETYTFSDNPRGDSEVIGQVYGGGDIKGTEFYTTGADGGLTQVDHAKIISYYQDQTANGVSPLDIVRYLAEAGVSGEVMPGSDVTYGDAIMQGILDGMLAGDDGDDGGDQTQDLGGDDNGGDDGFAVESEKDFGTDYVIPDETGGRQNIDDLGDDFGGDFGGELTIDDGRLDNEFFVPDGTPPTDFPPEEEPPPELPPEFGPPPEEEIFFGSAPADPSEAVLPGPVRGGDYTPQWGELFAYTTLTPYQKEKLGPMRNYIKEVKGMLS